MVNESEKIPSHLRISQEEGQQISKELIGSEDIPSFIHLAIAELIEARRLRRTNELPEAGK